MKNVILSDYFLFVSVSLESSVMGHDEMLQVLKEKMRLEGQLESLSSEANQVLLHPSFCACIFCFFCTNPLYIYHTVIECTQ